MKKTFLLTILYIILFAPYQSAFAANGKIRLAWDRNQERDLAGYKLYYGVYPWSFEEPIKISKKTSYILENLEKGQRYFITLTARNWKKHESFFSNQVYGIAHDAIYGNWVFDISGKDKGGAILFFDDNNNDDKLWGYGITERNGLFRIEGTYAIDDNDYRKLAATLSFLDFENNDNLSPDPVKIYGKIDSKYAKVTLKTDREDNPIASMSFKGLWKAGEEVHKSLSIIEDWAIKITGRINGKSTKGTIDSFKIEPFQINGESYPHLFKISGSGFINEGPVDVEGVFFLTETDKVYGVYEITGAIPETGFFSGEIKSTSEKFSFKFESDNGNRYTFKGERILE